MTDETKSGSATVTKCFHCGEDCLAEKVVFDSRSFCCQGCQLVYEILSENKLSTYYDYNASPGISPGKAKSAGQFAFLDDEGVKKKLLQFNEGDLAVVTFYIPQMHCSSCIWLLENLNTLIPAVVRSRVNFIRRNVTISFQENKLSLRDLVHVLSKIGYEPHLDMADLEGKSVRVKDRSPVYRIGIAGFVFGNIMLFSFPEYFSLNEITDPGFSAVFSYINLALSLPVLFYCSAPFFKSAAKSLQQKFLNIDVPIALGIGVMFIRSFIEIISGSGSGYLDTMSGLVFFMLIGRSFQDKSYRTISFDRDYKSFFPIAVMCRKKGRGEETSVPVSSIETDDHLIIRNGELIPADSVLIKGNARIDYSFVTGESALHEKSIGTLIYAGGRQSGESIEVKVLKSVSQSYLTQLWNQEAFAREDDSHSFQNLVSRISHYFTLAIVLIAVAGWAFWIFEKDMVKAWSAFTAVLIIACPCALAISSPFTLGNIIRIFGRRKFYLKNVNVIEKLAKIDTIVFDKTGTLTRRDPESLRFIGEALTSYEQRIISSVVRHSSHPLSRMVYAGLPEHDSLPNENFREIAGAGLSAVVDDFHVRIGSSAFTQSREDEHAINRSRIYISINGSPRGYFELGNTYREGLESTIKGLQKEGMKLEVLSGDNEGERAYLQSVFGNQCELRFNQTPHQKLAVIKDLQSAGRKVLMVGDGLNDAGALKQSDVGISVSDDVNNFSPASDAILGSENFIALPSFLSLSKASYTIILISFSISLLYNIVGLSFAWQGTLSPLVAAILMPLSSVSIIVFTSAAANYLSRTGKYRQNSKN